MKRFLLMGAGVCVWNAGVQLDHSITMAVFLFLVGCALDCASNHFPVAP